VVSGLTAVAGFHRWVKNVPNGRPPCRTRWSSIAATWRICMQKDRSLREQAHDALDRAMAARGTERQRLLEEAARLHRLAIEEEARRNPPDAEEDV